MCSQVDSSLAAQTVVLAVAGTGLTVRIDHRLRMCANVYANPAAAGNMHTKEAKRERVVGFQWTH